MAVNKEKLLQVNGNTVTPDYESYIIYERAKGIIEKAKSVSEVVYASGYAARLCDELYEKCEDEAKADTAVEMVAAFIALKIDELRGEAADKKESK